MSQELWKNVELSIIEDTYERLKPYVRRTPSLPVPGNPGIVLKLELLQKTGTFKYRGALNQMLASPDAKGVTAVSAGNHAIAVACAAKELGRKAKVVLLGSANAERRAQAEKYGAEIEVFDDGADAFARAQELESEEGLLFVHPFNGPRVAEATAGVAKEFMEDAADLDAVLVSIGGGGLASGIGAYIYQKFPDCKVIGVEPEGACGMRQSFDAGKPVEHLKVRTVADSLGPPMMLEYTYQCCKHYLSDIAVISDAQMKLAMRQMFYEWHLAVEPAAAAPLAALQGPLKESLEDAKVGLILCGTCIDAESYFQLISE